MILCKPEQIVIKERYRRTLDPAKLKELQLSIMDNGLVHLPVVRFESPSPALPTLVVGERRVRAMTMAIQEGLCFSYMGKLVPEGCIPVAVWDELTPAHAREVELEENAQRADLTWQEHAQAVAALHALRKEQDPSWTLRKTSEELTGTAEPSSVQNTLLLAKHMDRARVASAPTAAIAMKILKAELQNELQAALGMEVMLNTSRHTLRHGDAIKEMSTLPDEAFDVILTDPPYGIGAEKFGRDFTEGVHFGASGHDYGDNWRDVSALLIQFAIHAYRVAARQAHMYMFCAVEHFVELRGDFILQGWDVWPHPMIWHKSPGFPPRPNHGPSRAYECILYALKGDKPVNYLAGDVLTIPFEGERLCAAQKPVALFVELLKRSVLPGAKILDPFCGSGTIFEAADIVMAEATGFDSDPAMVGIARGRLK